MKYFEKVKNKIEYKKDAIILGIESSCDETCASVVKGGREVMSNVISSQIDIHKRYGGVVPEIASRNHTMSVVSVVDEALKKAGVTLFEIDAIAVTYGAGLVGALLTGVTYAKTLCYALDIPLIKVNHIRGHMSANYLQDKSLQPPFLCVVTSGGHTAILKVNDYLSHEFLGGTLDDAVGEAFDKVAKTLNLPYPGGPQISKLALEGEANIQLPKMLKNEKNYNFSYSGLKTAVINYVHTKQQKGEEFSKADLAKSFEVSAIDVLVEKSELALKSHNFSTVVVCGGVGANDYYRKEMQKMADKNKFKLVLPEKIYCTDNAAMIASEGYIQYYYGKDLSDLDLNAVPQIKL